MPGVALYSRNENVFCAKRSSPDPSVLDFTPLVCLVIPCLFLINRFLDGDLTLGDAYGDRKSLTVMGLSDPVISCLFLLSLIH